MTFRMWTKWAVLQVLAKQDLNAERGECFTQQKGIQGYRLAALVAANMSGIDKLMPLAIGK